MIDTLTDLITDEKYDLLVYKFDNGLILNHIHSKFKKSFEIILIVRAGVQDQKESETELAHLTEHLFAFFTSEKYSDYTENVIRLTDMGLILEAITSYTHTTYKIYGQIEYFTLVLEIILNATNGFKLDEYILRQEKNAVISESYGYDKPLEKIKKSIDFKNEEGKQLLLKRLRSFVNKWYIPRYMSLNILTSLNPEQVDNLVEYINDRYFGPVIKITRPRRYNFFGISQQYRLGNNKFAYIYTEDDITSFVVEFKINHDIIDTQIYILPTMLDILGTIHHVLCRDKIDKFYENIVFDFNTFYDYSNIYLKSNYESWFELQKRILNADNKSVLMKIIEENYNTSTIDLKDYYVTCLSYGFPVKKVLLTSEDIYNIIIEMMKYDNIHIEHTGKEEIDFSKILVKF